MAEQAQIDQATKEAPASEGQSFDPHEAAAMFGDRLDPRGSYDEEPQEDESEGDFDTVDESDADEADDELDDVNDEQTTDEDDIDDEDEQESDELDDEDESEDDDEDEDDESEAYELPEDAVLVVDGQRMTLAELRDGNMRQSDYTKKTQEVAQQRQQVQEWAQQAEQVLSEQSQHINALGMMLEQQVMADQQYDWDTLAQEDPGTFLQLQRQAQERQGILQQLKETQQQQAEQQQQQLAEQFQHHVQEQRQALLQHPNFQHWKDPQKMQQHREQIKNYLFENGLNKTQVQGISDVSVLNLVVKAMKFDEIQGKRKTTKRKVKKAPKMVKSNARQGKRAQRQSDESRLRKRLAKSDGDVMDAAAILQHRANR